MISTIMLGVRDLARAKTFYTASLATTVEKDHPNFVSLSLRGGLSSLALYEWTAAAHDAGVSPEGSGFRGVSFHFITDTPETVDQIIAKAEAAGGSVVRKPQAAQWGGYFGYFADPDGHLWKVTTSKLTHVELPAQDTRSSWVAVRRDQHDHDRP
ncbi:VOC family protein [Actinopolymorpha alba]|uniref:VOC family protein n=1 Tax=Actinopolymorpha alba TaxID=533267 RepID=UPI00192AC889|nr:VOC family protein [Actinopolymorpha alba]